METIQKILNHLETYPSDETVTWGTLYELLKQVQFEEYSNR